MASDRDQQAADLDQATSDQTHEPGVGEATYRSTRATRDQTTVERDQATQARDLSTHARGATARIRDATAARRDAAARERDEMARERDRLADARDAEIERWERSRGLGERPATTGREIVRRAAYDRRRAAEDRARAAEHRAAAAREREQAARERDQAARDREAAERELAGAGLDELTDTLTRRAGLSALQREIDRVERTKESLVVAFIDIDGLKRVNDEQGHPAGDRLLCEVTRHIREDLRSYDLIIRLGGDEFLCSFTGAGLDIAHRRFDHVRTQLDEGTSFSVGFAEHRADGSVEELIEHADAAMLATRRQRQGGASPSALPLGGNLDDRGIHQPLDGGAVVGVDRRARQGGAQAASGGERDRA